MTLTQDENGSAVLRLEGDCTVEQAAAIHEQLLKALEEQDGVALDLTAVSRADVSLQQIICSTHRSFAARGKPVRLEGQPAQAVLETLSRGGFGQVCVFPMHSCLFKGAEDHE